MTSFLEPGKHVTEPRVKQPPAPGEESAGPAMAPYLTELHAATRELRLAYRALRRDWTLWRDFATATSSGATGEVDDFTPIPQGFEVEVERISVSVGGASSAALATVFLGGANETQIVDVFSSLVGSSPSRNSHMYAPPIRLLGGERLIVVFSAVAGGNQPLIVRFDGRKREPS